MGKRTFESALGRLEEIASILEQGGASLEQSLKLYEEGSRLAAFCSDTIKQAQCRITEFDPSQQTDAKEDGEDE